jgi:hypothetical protein
MQALDTIATILLFIVLIAWVCLSIYAGAMSVTLSDSGAPGVALIGVALAVIGIPLSVIVVYVLAVVRAWHADGYTFYYPLVAFVVGTVAAALVLGVAWAILSLGLRIHGTDEDRRRDGKGGQPRDPGHSADAEVPRTAPHVDTTPTAAPPRLLVFERTHDSRDGTLSVELGMERVTGRRYLRTPMPQRNGEFEEYRGIDRQEYETFIADPAAAHIFAAECRRQEHGDRWMSWPGSPAPKPIARDRTRLAKKRATLLTDYPTDSSGVPVEGIPVGTAFVLIVGSSVQSDGNVQVRLLGEETAVVSIDAGQLGL